MIRYKFVVAGILALLLLEACAGKSHSDRTELLMGENRTLGQDPPDWMILRPGTFAYYGAPADEACSSEDEFLVYNSTGDETKGCVAVKQGSWVRIRHIVRVGESKYVVAVTPPDANKPVSYAGAAELSPNIPEGTELQIYDVVAESPSSTSEAQDDDGVDILDAKGSTIGELLDHTRVRVMEVDPGDEKTSTYVSVDVLSGAHTGMKGYVDLDELIATTGDQDLDGFLGATPTE